MSIKPSLSQLRLIADDELQRELASPDHDDATRHLILAEMIRRSARTNSRPNWTQWATLALALAAVILAGIAAFPVLDDLGESRWLDW